MKKIFETSDDLHVVARVVYAKSGDTKAYADEKYSQTITAAALSDLFVKGCLIASGENMFRPVAMNTKGGVVTLTYVTTTSSSSTTAVMATLVSTDATA